jgi:hypothetical protein
MVHRDIMSSDTFEKLSDEELQGLLDEATALFNRKYVENVKDARPLARECHVNTRFFLTSHFIYLFQAPF